MASVWTEDVGMQNLAKETKIIVTFESLKLCLFY